MTGIRTWLTREAFRPMKSFLRKLGDCGDDPRPASLVCSEGFWEELRQHLLKTDGKERVAFSLLGRSEEAGRSIYYGHRLMTIPDDHCVEQHSCLVEPDPTAVVDCFDAYGRSYAAAFMHAHSHPFCNTASFSGTDNAYLPGNVTSLREYLAATDSHRPCRFLRMVTGQHEGGFRIEVYDSELRFVEDIAEVRVVGARGLRSIRRGGLSDGTWANQPELNESEMARLDRNVRWLGARGQQAIIKTHVAVAGVGGVGTELIKICRGLGFKEYTVIDMDKLESANLNRLMWGIADVGEFKVELAKRFILAAVPDAEVHCLRLTVESPEAQEALSRADIILAAVDNDSTRLNLQILAARTLKPLIDLGSGIQLERGSRKVRGMGAQVSFYAPGGPCLACQGLDLKSIDDPAQREARRSIGYIEGTDETPASVVTINSVIAGIAGDMLVKYLTGFTEAPTLVTYDALEHTSLSIRLGGDPGCPICGKSGIQGLGLEQEAALPAPKPTEDLFAQQSPVAEEAHRIAVTASNVALESSKNGK